jgi:hypothetical protein
MRHRPDSTQAAIVKGLREAGYTVIPIGEPVDLLVGREDLGGWNSLGIYKWGWRLLEVKKKSGLRRKDQPTQNRFVDETHTPIVSSLEEALEALK